MKAHRERERERERECEKNESLVNETIEGVLYL